MSSDKFLIFGLNFQTMKNKNSFTKFSEKNKQTNKQNFPYFFFYRERKKERKKKLRGLRVKMKLQNKKEVAALAKMAPSRTQRSQFLLLKFFLVFRFLSCNPRNRNPSPLVFRCLFVLKEKKRFSTLQNLSWNTNKTQMSSEPSKCHCCCCCCCRRWNSIETRSTTFRGLFLSYTHTHTHALTGIRYRGQSTRHTHTHTTTPPLGIHFL